MTDGQYIQDIVSFNDGRLKYCFKKGMALTTPKVVGSIPGIAHTWKQIYGIMECKSPKCINVKML